MKSENINALDEIHKGACMGEDAINFILDKVNKEDFKKVLEKSLEDYKNIARKIEDLYPKYDEGKPHSTSALNKAMTWSSVEFKTMNDDSDSKIAELLIQGVNMGIIEGKKILNKKQINNEVEDIVDQYVRMQERSLDVLKEYL